MGRRIIIMMALFTLAVCGCASSTSPEIASTTPVEPSLVTRLPSIGQELSSVEKPEKVIQLSAYEDYEDQQQDEIFTTAKKPTTTLFKGPTTLDELVSYAVANNPNIDAARSKAESLISRVPQSQSLDDPMLTTTAFIEEIQTAAGPQEAMISLSQKFPWFGKLEARGEISYHDAQVAYADLADVELAVIERVKLAYYDLYFIDSAIGVYNELKPQIKDVIAITRVMNKTNAKKVGLESVLQAEVTLHKLDITLTELRQAKLKAKARLAEALNLPRDATMEIQTEISNHSLPSDASSLVAMLDFCQPQLEARRQAMTRDDWSITLAEKNYYPDVTLGFNWAAIGATGLSPVATGDDAYALVVGINLPIYRTKRDAAVREAQFKTARSSQQYDAVWNALRADVEKLHAQASEHQQVLKILNQDILRKAKQSFSLSVEAFRVNRIGFQQLIDSYEDLLRFRIDYHFRKTSREQAIAQLQRTVGCALTRNPKLSPVPEEVPQPKQ